VNRLCTEIKTQQCAIIIIVKRGAYRTRQIATLESWTRPKAKRLKVATPTVTATSATLADAPTATSRATRAEVGGHNVPSGPRKRL